MTDMAAEGASSHGNPVSTLGFFLLLVIVPQYLPVYGVDTFFLVQPTLTLPQMKRKIMTHPTTPPPTDSTEIFFARKSNGMQVWPTCCHRFGDVYASEFSDAERENLGGGRCFCEQCHGYGRCRFKTPRNAHDVYQNIEKTGLTAACLISKAADVIGHHADDILVSFGCGAGSCIAGYEYSRGSQFKQIYGVEVEEIATRFAKATFPNLTVVKNVAQLDIPKDGRLIVITSLVGNIVDWQTVQAWAQFAANQRDEFTWINVGRDDDPENAIPSGEILLEEFGWTQEAIAPELSFPNWGNSNDPLRKGYTLSIKHWRI